MRDDVADLRVPYVIGEHGARALRLDLELGFAPISGPHLWDVITERGIDLAFHRFGPSGGDGLYLWDGSRGLIVLNASKRPLRLRFTAAHELGHHEMHRHTLGNLILSDLDVSAGQRPSVEQEANAFAAEFLAPAAALRREFADQDPKAIEPTDIVRLMRTYGVSYDSLLYRLKDSGVITSRDRARLDAAGKGRVRQLQQALGFDEERLFGTPQQLLPEDFVLRTLQLYNAGAIDGARLAELLRTNKEEALDRAGALAPQLPESTPELDALLDI